VAMKTNSSISIIGCGSWPMTIAFILAHNGIPTKIWCHRQALVDEINNDHQHKKIFPTMTLSPLIQASNSVEEVCKGSDRIIIGLASKFYDVIEKNKRHLKGKHILSLTKGLFVHKESLSISVYIQKIADAASISVLSGPNLAGEIIQKNPSTTVIASENNRESEFWQKKLSNAWFRVYTSQDIIGAEWGGILKNVMAIASGYISGRGFGYNAKAALITRGIKEMIIYGRTKGATEASFFGLSGLGDLIATCLSPESRNYKAGVALSKNQTVESINEMYNAEGLKTVKLCVEDAKKLGLDLPIFFVLYDVLYNHLDAEKAIERLMNRHLKEE
jgi:glycerol-3-phosphate dehydrogenase (NAD(P)+)